MYSGGHQLFFVLCLLLCSILHFTVANQDQNDNELSCPTKETSTHITLHTLMNGNASEGTGCTSRTQCANANSGFNIGRDFKTCACGMFAVFEPSHITVEYPAHGIESRYIFNASSLQTIKNVYKASRASRGEWICSQVWGEPLVTDCNEQDRNSRNLQKYIPFPEIFCACSPVYGSVDFNQLCDYTERLMSLWNWKDLTPKLIHIETPDKDTHTKGYFYEICEKGYEKDNGDQVECTHSTGHDTAEGAQALTWTCFKNCRVSSNYPAPDKYLWPDMVLDHRCCAAWDCSTTNKCNKLSNDRTCSSFNETQPYGGFFVYFDCLEEFSNLSIVPFNTTTNTNCMQTDQGEVCMCAHPNSTVTMINPQCSVLMSGGETRKQEDEWPGISPDDTVAVAMIQCGYGVREFFCFTKVDFEPERIMIYHLDSTDKAKEEGMTSTILNNIYAGYNNTQIRQKSIWLCHEIEHDLVALCVCKHAQGVELPDRNCMKNTVLSEIDGKAPNQTDFPLKIVQQVDSRARKYKDKDCLKFDRWSCIMTDHVKPTTTTRTTPTQEITTTTSTTTKTTSDPGKTPVPFTTHQPPQPLNVIQPETKEDSPGISFNLRIGILMLCFLVALIIFGTIVAFIVRHRIDTGRLPRNKDDGELTARDDSELTAKGSD